MMMMMTTRVMMMTPFTRAHHTYNNTHKHTYVQKERKLSKFGGYTTLRNVSGRRGGGGLMSVELGTQTVIIIKLQCGRVDIFVLCFVFLTLLFRGRPLDADYPKQKIGE